MYITRTNISLGISTTQVNNTWEAAFKNPLNSMLTNTQDITLVKYRVYGLQIDYSTSQNIIVNTGYAYSDNKINRINLTNSLTVSFSNSNGALGLDTGSKANSTWYYVWVIKNTSGTVSALYSASSTSPTLPSGYIHKKLIGAVRVDSSGNIVPFYTYGSGNTKEFIYDQAQTALSTGTATTYTNISTSSLIPVSITQLGLFGIFLYTSGTTAASGTWNGYLKNPNATVGALKVKTCTSSTFNAKGGKDVVTTGYVNTDSSGIVQYKVDSATNTPTLDVYVYGFVLEL